MRRITRLALLMLTLGVPATVGAQTFPCQTLQDARSGYGTPMTPREVGEMLNRVSWVHREAGWGLLGKRSGNNCPNPAGTLVSCDFLVHLPTLTGFDALRDSEGDAAVLCPTHGENMTAAIANGSRTFVAPVMPGGDPIVNIPPPIVNITPLPSFDLSPVLNWLQTINAQQSLDTQAILASQAATLAELREFRAAVKREYDGWWKRILTYALPILGGLGLGLGR